MTTSTRQPHGQPTDPIDWPREVMLATAAGAATGLFAIHSWPRTAQLGWHAAVAGAAGAGAVLLARRPELLERRRPAGDPVVVDQLPIEPTPPLVSAAIGVLTAVAAAAVSVGSAATDRRLERRLTRRGVRHPRVWIGVVGGAIALGSSVADRLAPSRD